MSTAAVRTAAVSTAVPEFPWPLDPPLLAVLALPDLPADDGR
ncbi:hypothetical protein [Streptomyces sp. NRRL S-495]|nr:hypothetical protein [Streptomyces sp. NRRL S-495]